MFLKLRGETSHCLPVLVGKIVVQLARFFASFVGYSAESLLLI